MFAELYERGLKEGQQARVLPEGGAPVGAEPITLRLPHTATSVRGDIKIVFKKCNAIIGNNVSVNEWLCYMVM